MRNGWMVAVIALSFSCAQASQTYLSLIEQEPTDAACQNHQSWVLDPSNNGVYESGIIPGGGDWPDGFIVWRHQYIVDRRDGAVFNCWLDFSEDIGFPPQEPFRSSQSNADIMASVIESDIPLTSPDGNFTYIWFLGAVVYKNYNGTMEYSKPAIPILLISEPGFETTRSSFQYLIAMYPDVHQSIKTEYGLAGILPSPPPTPIPEPSSYFSWSNWSKFFEPGVAAKSLLGFRELGRVLFHRLVGLEMKPKMNRDPLKLKRPVGSRWKPIPAREEKN